MIFPPRTQMRNKSWWICLKMTHGALKANICATFIFPFYLNDNLISLKINSGCYFHFLVIGFFDWSPSRRLAKLIFSVWGQNTNKYVSHMVRHTQLFTRKSHLLLSCMKPFILSRAFTSRLQNNENHRPPAPTSVRLQLYLLPAT